MKPRSQFILVDGVKLHVADWGGSGPDLLLLHANGFLGWVYRRMITKLVGQYHVRTMDLRGQGDSEKPPLDLLSERRTKDPVRRLVFSANRSFTTGGDP